MSILTRNQEYKYQYKIISTSGAPICGYGPSMVIAIPDNLLDIKSIYVHAIIKFDTTVAIADRKVTWIGGKFKTKFFNDGQYNVSIPDPSSDTMIPVNKLADPITRIADIKIDITQLKNTIIQDSLNSSYGQPSIALNILNGPLINSNSINGELILWKIDLVYTTI